MAVGICADIDDLGVFDGEDLVEPFGWGGTGSLGLAGHAETEHDGVAVDLDTFDGCLDALGHEAPVPVEDLAAIGAVTGPADLGVQEGFEQIEIGVAVGGFEMTGDVGHRSGTE